VKIDTNQIPAEGLTLVEEFSPLSLDLDTEIIKFKLPVKVKADISKISNAVTVNFAFEGKMSVSCSRCLTDFEISLKKKVVLNYLADKSQPVIDFDPDIREEIILDYPMKPLCKSDCKGFCPKCGKNLNEGKCSC